MKYAWEDNGGLVMVHTNGFPGPDLAFTYEGRARRKVIDLFNLTVPEQHRRFDPNETQWDKQ